MIDAATAISAGSAIGKLLGGKGGSVGGNLRTQYHEARVAEERRYRATRRGAEAAGINPLLVMGGPSLPMPSVDASRPSMGSAIADIGMIVADGMNRREDLARATSAEKENDRLRDQVKELTLRPKVAGLYDGLGLRPRPSSVVSAAAAPPAAATSGSNTVPLPARSGYGSNGKDGLPTYALPGENPEFESDLYLGIREGSEVMDPVISEVADRMFFTPEHRADREKRWIDRSARWPTALRQIGQGMTLTNPQATKERANLRNKAQAMGIW